MPVYGHLQAPAHLDEFERPLLAEWIALGEEAGGKWPEVIITPPTDLVGSSRALRISAAGWSRCCTWAAATPTTTCWYTCRTRARGWPAT